MFSAKKLAILALILTQMLAVIYCGSYDNTDTWVPSNKSMAFPHNAILGGHDSSRYKNYVGRVIYNKSVLPARVVPEFGLANFNTDSVSLQATSYELLIANETISYKWIPSYKGYLEENAVCVGTSDNDDRVFICRAQTDDGHLIGAVFSGKGYCFIRERGDLRKIFSYETLVREVYPPIWVPFVSQSSNN